MIREPKSEAVIGWIESSGDALHLAIAASLSAQGILCLDDAMIESAKSLGMKVVTV